jgi:hypothetical protein
LPEKPQKTDLAKQTLPERPQKRDLAKEALQKDLAKDLSRETNIRSFNLAKETLEVISSKNFIIKRLPFLLDSQHSQLTFREGQKKRRNHL